MLKLVDVNSNEYHIIVRECFKYGYNGNKSTWVLSTFPTNYE